MRERDKESVKTMIRIRLVWRINGVQGHGLPFRPDERKLLEAWRDQGNREWGSGTHWIEEFEA